MCRKFGNIPKVWKGTGSKEKPKGSRENMKREHGWKNARSRGWKCEVSWTSICLLKSVPTVFLYGEPSHGWLIFNYWSNLFNWRNLGISWFHQSRSGLSANWTVPCYQIAKIIISSYEDARIIWAPPHNKWLRIGIYQYLYSYFHEMWKFCLEIRIVNGNKNSSLYQNA